MKSTILVYCRRLCSLKATASNRNLICFKDWTAEDINKVLISAKSLKSPQNGCRDKLATLRGLKILLLMDMYSPFMKISTINAARLVGAKFTRVFVNTFIEEQYNCEYYSLMSDVILIIASTHDCLFKFAKRSEVPVISLMSRIHQSLESLSCLAVILEEFNYLKGINVSYIGPASQLLNSFLLLCPLLGINLKFMCCCQDNMVSPIQLKEGYALCKHTDIKLKQCTQSDELYANTDVYIRGTTLEKKEGALFTFELKEMDRGSEKWIYIHSLPREDRVSEQLFFHKNARTRDYLKNLEFICAALIAYCVKNVEF